MLYATVRQRKIHVKNPVTVIRNGVGVDELTLDMDDEWKEMTSIVCVFTTHYTEERENTEEDTGTENTEDTGEENTGEEETDDGTAAAAATWTSLKTEEKEIVKEVLFSYGQPVIVPWENLTEVGSLSVSCTGYVGEEKVMTTMKPDSFWMIVENGPVSGDVPEVATPSLYEQILGAVGEAKAAAKTAEAVSKELCEARDRGVFNGADGLDGKDGRDGADGADGKDGAPGKDGSDANVTRENIAAALGYTPFGAAGGTEGQFAVSDGQGGITWLSLINVGEVGA